LIPYNRGPALYYNEYPATVNALNQVDIHAQVSGYITGIYFKDGQHVDKGASAYILSTSNNMQEAITKLLPI
jgi:membrane fusion protein (multidrug efflux system)